MAWEIARLRNRLHRCGGAAWRLDGPDIHARFAAAGLAATRPATGGVRLLKWRPAQFLEAIALEMPRGSVKELDYVGVIQGHTCKNLAPQADLLDASQDRPRRRGPQLGNASLAG